MTKSFFDNVLLCKVIQAVAREIGMLLSVFALDMHRSNHN